MASVYEGHTVCSAGLRFIDVVAGHWQPWANSHRALGICLSLCCKAGPSSERQALSM